MGSCLVRHPRRQVIPDGQAQEEQGSPDRGPHRPGEASVSFLLVEAQRRGARHLTLPLTRTQFAEYLHADRTAVSRELSRMRDDGLIDYHRNSFVLLSLDEAALMTD